MATTLVMDTEQEGTLVIDTGELLERFESRIETPVIERVKHNRVLQRKHCHSCNKTGFYMLNQRMLENVGGRDFAMYGCMKCGDVSLAHIRGR